MFQKKASTSRSALASPLVRLLLVLLGIGSGWAGTFTVFGPQSYVRDKGKPVTVSSRFSILNPNTQYTLHVEAPRTDEDKDQDSDDGDPRARASIFLNGKEIIDFDDFLLHEHDKDARSSPVLVIEKPVQLLLSNTIAVEVRGKLGVSVTVSIIGVDNDPPVITASANPAADIFGWNNTDVVVTFTCSDQTSGVASCPSPVKVSQEGANQVIRGTATDRAGNTGSTSITVNLDKTPPIIAASPAPPANAAGWNNTAVTVTFHCVDALSGVATCTPPVTLSNEGANQVVNGTAVDKAGNSSNTSASVKIDETPPAITISSPADGALVSTPSMAVTGAVIDQLSGVAGITCDGSAAVFQQGVFNCSVSLNPGANTVTVLATDVAGNTTTKSFSVTLATQLSITDFNPKSVSAGSLVTISGQNLIPVSGGSPQVTLTSLGGGTIVAPISTFTSTSIVFVVPAGAASGDITVTAGNQSGTSASPLTIVAPSSFSLTVGPATANLIQGQSTSYAVTLNSVNGFSQLATLSVTGVPSGLAATFNPPQVTAGQTAVLTITAPANQNPGTANLTIAASAVVGGLALTQSANAVLKVQPIATSFIGRTTVDDAMQTPLAGVAVTFLGVDGMGGSTGCSGETQSDQAGNFSFFNLSQSCAGEQLVRYDGSAAATAHDRNTGVSPVYAGVDLLYNITANTVTTPTNLIRLPRVDDKETALVNQNSSDDQTFSFKTIPGLTVTIYSGTVFTLADGSTPNPFPLIAINVPVDRLPDEMPSGNTTVTPFIVAFQPANSVASQPVAVTFPNTLNTPPGINVELDTLNPTIGMMVRYGTGTVSGDGTQIVPDLDPAHPNHRFGRYLTIRIPESVLNRVHRRMRKVG